MTLYIKDMLKTHEERRETGREEGKTVANWLVSSFFEYP